MDDFLFASETNEIPKLKLKPWKILIADDESEIHTITKIVLSTFDFENKGVEIYDAYTGDEAISILRNNPDIAVILLDVVMERDDSGLVTARRIREELNNQSIRIILRTGQPGSAPEKEVITRYDINDYKEKTELTTTKLFTTVLTALRSYRDLHTIEQNKIGLEKIIDSTSTIMEFKNLKLFAEGVLTQLVALLNLNSDSLIVNRQIDGLTLDVKNDGYRVLASTGNFISKNLEDILNERIEDLFRRAIKQSHSFFQDNVFIGYFNNNNESINLIYIEGNETINDIDKNLINIFSNNVSVAFNNIHLTNEIIDTQKEIIETLSEVVEKRSKETSNHVLRVANISKFLGIKYGLNTKDTEILAMASPLHDVGKTGIPDAILLKPGKLTPEEYNIMKTHTDIGKNILGKSTRPLLKAGSIIASEHHEKWDGTGYPLGLKEHKIHIYGRITALADVFDALYHKRCYKDAWPLEDIINLISNEKGKHFDPNLVDIFLDNINDILKIVEKYR